MSKNFQSGDVSTRENGLQAHGDILQDALRNVIEANNLIAVLVTGIDNEVRGILGASSLEWAG